MSSMLDQMADLLLAGDEIAFSDLVRDWHRSEYECQLTPKPVDADSRKLALKASIVERLVEVLNMPPHNANQSAPPWTNSVSGFGEVVKLQSDRLLEDEDYCEAFEKRGFLVAKNFIFLSNAGWAGGRYARYSCAAGLGAVHPCLKRSHLYFG
ncbi:hypothetical protein [Exilibacterium tricleocarpae]|nr:hypothetical protein [Exilibacterium tricleocarpae]